MKSVSNATISQEQADRLRDYLEQDRSEHTKLGHKWHLDGGKLQSALACAGIEVEKPPALPPKPPPAPKRKLLVTVDGDLMVPADANLNGAYCSIVIDVFDGTGFLLGTIYESETESIRFQNADDL